MELGTSFPSFVLLEETLKNYSNTNFVRFYKRESRTVLAAKKKGLTRYLNPVLKYYSIVFWCIRGGKNFKSSAKDIRPSSTFQNSCPAHIRFRASECGNFLEVVGINLDHNHEVSSDLYRHLPNTKRLSSECRNERGNRSKPKIDGQLITQKVKNARQMDADVLEPIKSSTDLNNLSSVYQELNQKYGDHCIALLEASYESNSSVYKALLFSTPRMKATMETYPDFLEINVAIKLDKLECFVYFISAEDSVGLLEVVTVGFLPSRCHISLLWLLESFKEANPKWIHTRGILVDKHLEESQLVQQSFPQASILISPSNTMKTLEREIVEKVDVSNVQRLSLELFKKMVYTTNVNTFNRLCKLLKSLLPSNTFKHFEDKWLNIRDKWSFCGNFNESHYLTQSKNRLELLNGKLKTILELATSLEMFVDEMFVLLDVINEERNRDAAQAMQKRQVVHFEVGSPEERYIAILTNFASKLVLQQIDLANELTEDKVDLSTTILACTCNFITLLLLPCCHIFKVRNTSGLNLFDMSFCTNRWTISYYQKHLVQILSMKRVIPIKAANNDHNEDDPLPTKQQRYRNALFISKTMAEKVSEVSGEQYERRMDDMKKLMEQWNDDDNILELKVESEEVVFFSD